MAIYELVGLNEATPQLVAPTAVDFGGIAGGLLVAGSIAGNGIISTGDVSLSGNDLILGGGKIQFDNANYRITQVSDLLEYHAGGTGIHIFNIDNVPKLTIDAAIISLRGNALTLDIDETIIIAETVDGMSLTVPTGDDFAFVIDVTPEFTIDAANINFHGNNLLNAPHDHEDGAGGSQLIATAALSATGTKDNTTFLRGDDTWDVPQGVEISTWTVPHDSDNNNLILGTGSVQFDDVNTLIKQVGSNIELVSANELIYKIGAQTKFSVSSSKTSIHDNVLALGNGHIEFTTNNYRITQVLSSLQYNVPSGDKHIFNINNAPEFTLDAANIDLHNKNIANVLNITAATYTVGGFSGTSFSGAVSNITVVNGIVTAAS